MAKYLYRHFTEQTDNELFDRNHRPNELAPRSGIYRCMGCGREAAVPEGNRLPGYDHHAHDREQGSPRWRLIVYADHRPQSGKPAAGGPAPVAFAKAELVDQGGIAILDRLEAVGR
jgi:hypothetical protein